MSMSLTSSTSFLWRAVRRHCTMQLNSYRFYPGFIPTGTPLFFERPACLSKSTISHCVRYSTSQLHDQVVYFSDTGIKRATEYRSKDSWLMSAFSRCGTLVVPVAENRNLVKNGEPLIVPVHQTGFIENQNGLEFVFLGLIGKDEVPIFAMDVSHQLSMEASKPEWLEGAELVDLRAHLPTMKTSEAALLAYARALLEWRSKNRFCGYCGSKTISQEGGHSLKCNSKHCNAVIYPRLDPAVIMAVAHGDYILLGRQSHWEPGRYSLLAGFVEIGETFEMALEREVQEEVGLSIEKGSIRYIASQPWPFPQSLMIGFFANAVKSESTPPGSYLTAPRERTILIETEILSRIHQMESLPRPVINKDELEDAKWIHKDFLRAVVSEKCLPSGVKFHIPGKYAIARHLIEKWLNEVQCYKWIADEIQSVEIDEGSFKYVLLRIQDNCGNQKLIVRGNSSLPYHVDIFKQTQRIIGPLGLQAEPLGGGRIEHHSERKMLHIYGHSQAYGQANHNVTAWLLGQWLPFHEISVSWDGY